MSHSAAHLSSDVKPLTLPSKKLFYATFPPYSGPPKVASIKTFETFKGIENTYINI